MNQSSWNESGATVGSKTHLGKNFRAASRLANRGKLSIDPKHRASSRADRLKARICMNSGLRIVYRSSAIFPTLRDFPCSSNFSMRTKSFRCKCTLRNNSPETSAASQKLNFGTLPTPIQTPNFCSAFANRLRAINSKARCVREQLPITFTKSA